MDYMSYVERLVEKGARADCVMCGANDWRGLGEPLEAEVVALATPLPDGSYDAAHGHAAYGGFCANCGFVRLHAQVVIAPEEASH